MFNICKNISSSRCWFAYEWYMIITCRNRNRTGKLTLATFWMHIVDFHMICFFFFFYCFIIDFISFFFAKIWENRLVWPTRFYFFKWIFIIINQFQTSVGQVGTLDWIFKSIVTITTKGWTRHTLGTIWTTAFLMQLWGKRSLYFGCFYCLCLTWIRVCKATFITQINDWIYILKMPFQIIYRPCPKHINDIFNDTIIK